jgi:hypothetical protein
LCFLFSGFNVGCFAQENQDSVSNPKWIEKMNSHKVVKKLMGAITREPEADELPFNLKSEDAYRQYQGKIIRKIGIERIGFEKTILDTTRNLQNFISREANKLHTNTREFVIRNNLFVREGKPLNPYRIADNERTLRNLDFVMDARIFVKPVSPTSDSVDLLVVTRDVFSFGGSFSPDIPSKYRLNVQNINFGGLGQRIQFGEVFDLNRTPRHGYEGFYQVSNVMGSFVDASAGYTNLNSGVSIGNENERSLYFKLSRVLYQPFTRFAGAVELSDNSSMNVYRKPDSTFSDYWYRIQDYWLGYSFGYKKLTEDLKENRNRKFIALRAFDQRFLTSLHTGLTEADRFIYRDRVSVLAQLTFFRQDFYKTQYVVGFGRTEDIPYGYRISFTTGWERELGNKRPYLAGELHYNKVRPGGTILTYDIQLASYGKGTHPEDGLLSLNFTRYSKIYRVGRMILRNQFQSGYAALFNQHVKRGLDIRDVNGIVGFMPDSLVGPQRVTVSQETTLFTPWKPFGFHLAPIVRVDLALIKRNTELVQTRNFFSGFSLGFRARNENLIFNTIEVRLFYYPKTVERVERFRFNVTTNFRIRYPTNLVNKPATVFP